MRRQQTQSVSLFPFLAVLVCAMGALILLLLVTTRRIRSNVIQQARVAQLETTEQTPAVTHLDLSVPSSNEMFSDSPEPEPPEVTDPVDKPIVEPPQLILPQSVPEPIVVDIVDEPIPLAFVELLKSQLTQVNPVPPVATPKPMSDPNDNLRGVIAQLEETRRRMQSQIEAQQKIVDAGKSRVLDQERELKKSEADQAKLIELRQRAVARMRRMTEEEKSLTGQIQELRGAIRNATIAAPVETKFTIAAYDGRNGTVRRPILIECTDQGFRFIPEDVSIAEDDLRGFSSEFNPLLTGVRSLIDHSSTTTEEQQPYVLLVVRPSGALAFYSAKKLLKNLRQPFGYELLNDDFVLQEPEVDIVAQTNLRRAVAQTVSERANLMHVLRSDVPGESRQRGSSRRPSSGGAGRPMRIGRNGTVYLDEEPESVAGDPQNEFGSPFGESSRSNPARGQLNNPYGQPPGRGAPMAIGQSGGEGGGEGGGESGGESGGENLASVPNNRSSQTGNNGPGTGTAGRGRAGSDTGSGPGGPMQDGVFLKPTPRHGSNSTNGFSSNGGGHYGTAEQPGAPDGSSSSSANGTEQRSGSPDGGGGGSQSRANSNGTRQGGSNAGENPSGQPGAGSQPNFPNFRMPEPPRGQFGREPSIPSHKQNPFESPPARKPWSGSKRAWGVPGQSGAIGFERVVRVTAHPDFVQVADQRISMDDPNGRKSLTARVLAAINNQAKTWGQPSNGFYWVPLVKFAVAPNGDEVYRRVASPLRALGLTVETVSQHTYRGVR